MASIDVINATKDGTPVEIQLSTGNIVYRGPAGQPGPAGLQGPQGEPGPAGADGAAGSTPVKGVDYFTSADIADFIAQVPAPDLSSYATKSEVQTAIQNAEAGLLKREVVQILPVLNIDENTIYMVPKVGSNGDAYDEYMYISNAWEHIGSTEVDLSDYRRCVYLQSGRNLDATEQAKLNDILSYHRASGYTGVGSGAAPYDVYINGARIRYFSYGEYSNPERYKLLFWRQADTYESAGMLTYYIWWSNKPAELLYGGTTKLDADWLKISKDNSPRNLTTTSNDNNVGNNFKYIRDNYVRTVELPAYLSNSDILAIWTGENE